MRARISHVRDLAWLLTEIMHSLLQDDRPQQLLPNSWCGCRAPNFLRDSSGKRSDQYAHVVFDLSLASPYKSQSLVFGKALESPLPATYSLRMSSIFTPLDNVLGRRLRFDEA